MQEYKMVIRGLSGSKTVFDGQGNISIQNFTEFLTWLKSEYLDRGYTIQSVQNLRVIPADVPQNLPAIYEFAYHLVREVELPPTRASK